MPQNMHLDYLASNLNETLELIALPFPVLFTKNGFHITQRYTNNFQTFETAFVSFNSEVTA